MFHFNVLSYCFFLRVINSVLNSYVSITWSAAGDIITCTHTHAHTCTHTYTYTCENYVAHRLNYGRSRLGTYVDRYRELRAGIQLSSALCRTARRRRPRLPVTGTLRVRADFIRLWSSNRPPYSEVRLPPFDRCVTVYKLQNSVVERNQVIRLCPRKMQVACAFTRIYPYIRLRTFLFLRSGLLASR